jgi:hypothetical protein
MADITALLQDKLRLTLHLKLPELLERGVISLKENANPHHHCDVQNLVQHWSSKVLAHPPLSRSYIHVIIVCLHMRKNISGVNYLNWKIMSTLLSMPL